MPGLSLRAGLGGDFKGQSFVQVLAEGAMNAAALGEAAGLLANLHRRALRPPGATAAARADEVALAARQSATRTPDDEFNEFLKMVKEEGGTEFQATGKPISMQPHGGASQARSMLGVTGEQQSMHGLPRSVGKHVPGYDPNAALTTLGDRALHTELDRPGRKRSRTCDARVGRLPAPRRSTTRSPARSTGRRGCRQACGTP
jgi:hypothetical protein